MSRGYAVSLGALAMGLVAFRGIIHSELASDVAREAVVAMIGFAVVGWVAGRIADNLVRDSVEQNFRSRVDWYHEGLVEAGLIETESSADAES